VLCLILFIGQAVNEFVALGGSESINFGGESLRKCRELMSSGLRSYYRSLTIPYR
jgi:hypothetical protein